MVGATDILFISSLIIMLVSLISISYKTGFVFLSIWSITRRNRPKFEVDKSKVGKFIGLVIAALLLNIGYGLTIVQDTGEVEGILILSLFNTVFIAYGLVYWVLFKEKKNTKNHQ